MTEVSQAHVNVLFERFLSRRHNEPPDIDIDFEHERREEVIQYILWEVRLRTGGPHCCGITYRRSQRHPRSRQVMGLLDCVDRIGQIKFDWWDKGSVDRSCLREIGSRQRIRPSAACSNSPATPDCSRHPPAWAVRDHQAPSDPPTENARCEHNGWTSGDKDDIDAMGMKVGCFRWGCSPHPQSHGPTSARRGR